MLKVFLRTFDILNSILKEFSFKSYLPLAVKKKFTLSLFLCCLVGLAMGQEVKGIVKDAQTGEVLPYANVFLDNSTVGTTTDSNGKYTLALSPGFALLVISYVGYQTQSININPVVNETLEMNISLVQEKKALKEIQVEGTRDKAWEKKFRTFEKEFLGTTPNGKKSKILNPWVVDFIENDEKILIASASEPIQIENRGLGYSILFYLLRFEVKDKLVFLGRTKFTELEPVDEKQKNSWMRNRLDAYLGTEQHLFKAMIEGKVHQEGFELYSEKHPQKQIVRTGGLFSQELKKNLIPFTFSMTGNVKSEVYKIRLPGRIEVHYIHDTDHPIYRDVYARVFWIEPLQPVIEVNAKGILRDPTSVLESGYLRSLRVADMLPLDFDPKLVPREEE